MKGSPSHLERRSLSLVAMAAGREVSAHNRISPPLLAHGSLVRSSSPSPLPPRGVAAPAPRRGAPGYWSPPGSRPSWCGSAAPPSSGPSRPAIPSARVRPPSCRIHRNPDRGPCLLKRGQAAVRRPRQSSELHHDAAHKGRWAAGPSAELVIFLPCMSVRQEYYFYS